MAGAEDATKMQLSPSKKGDNRWMTHPTSLYLSALALLWPILVRIYMLTYDL